MSNQEAELRLRHVSSQSVVLGIECKFQLVVCSSWNGDSWVLLTLKGVAKSVVASHHSTPSCLHINFVHLAAIGGAVGGLYVVSSHGPCIPNLSVLRAATQKDVMWKVKM